MKTKLSLVMAVLVIASMLLSACGGSHTSPGYPSPCHTSPATADTSETQLTDTDQRLSQGYDCHQSRPRGFETLWRKYGVKTGHLS